MQIEKSLSLANPSPRNLTPGHKIGLSIVGLGLVLLLIALFGGLRSHVGLFLALALSSLAVGGITYAWFEYMNKPEGIKNNGVWHFGESSRGTIGWVFGVVITLFYIALYWFPEWLGQGSAGAGNSGMVALFDPLSILLKGQPASQWFVYGTFYTLAILVLGVKFIWKYRHNRYQQIRTFSVMFFQLGFAFLIPEILSSLNNTASFSDIPYNDFKNMWPLNYYFFDDYNIKAMLSPGSGNLGLSMLIWGLAMVFVVSPFLTYFFGKRWYCSWVCGCGGLAETAGDPFRQLSDKSLKAWKFERWMIHGVLLFAVLMTVAVIYSFYQKNGNESFWISKDMFIWGTVTLLLGIAAAVFFMRERFKHIKKDVRFLIVGLIVTTAGVIAINYLSGAKHVMFVESYPLRKWYGFFIGVTFSGVIGVGFYPLLGSRVWCRFGCPMAGLLGLQQRFFSRFRITTNGDQCISCGNCSTYCEMGIDVRSYAQKGQNIVRASCVGCGICAAVCPRGVLRLENGPNTDESRMESI